MLFFEEFFSKISPCVARKRCFLVISNRSPHPVESHFHPPIHGPKKVPLSFVSAYDIYFLLLSAFVIVECLSSITSTTTMQKLQGVPGTWALGMPGSANSRVR